MIRRIIFSLKGWGIASLLLAIALLFQHFFRNPLCFSWECISWFLAGILMAIFVYSLVILPFLPNKQWIRNSVLSLLFLAIYFLNLTIYKVDYTNNLLFTGKSLFVIAVIIVVISCFTANSIRYKSNLIIRQMNYPATSRRGNS